MKSIIKTKTRIMLVDPASGESVSYDRPYLVTWSAFFEAFTGRGVIEVFHAGLPLTASDKELQACLAEAEDEGLAIAAFVSIANGETPDETPKQEKKPKAPAKPKDEPPATQTGA